MSAPRGRSSLGTGLAAAFVLSACGAALLAALSPWLGGAAALRAVIALLGLAYTLYVIGGSGERVGRITTVAFWIVIASGAWLIGLPLVGYVLLHVGLVWLVRSLYHYSGLLPALADLGLSVLGAAFAAWAVQRSGSAWLGLWCFFLVQAFHALIPATLTQRSRAASTRPTTPSRARIAQRKRPCGVCPRLTDSLPSTRQRSSNMKTNILVTGIVLATVGAVLIYPTIRGNAAGTPPPRNVVAPIGAKRVEVVFVLDTTGSMSGLINAAQEKIWSIASTLAQAQQAPEISMGLVAYRDRGDAYVTQVIDLNRDLDSMYAKLMDFAADGGGDGPEAVNEALEAAIHRMSWSQDQSTYKVVFLVGDAPPHMDYQDDVKYPQVVAAAAAKGIVVNTIQCGSMSDTVAPWQHIASLGPAATSPWSRRAAPSRSRRRSTRRWRRYPPSSTPTRLYYGSG